MHDTMNSETRLFVLDTNVLIHDPSAIFRFEEHDIYLPMVVLEELDRHKTGVSELARNVRQANRFLMDLINHSSHHELIKGLPIAPFVTESKETKHGKLFFQTDELNPTLPSTLSNHHIDHTILAISLALQKKYPHKRITLVSKDINLRIKAGILGLRAEDYYSDRALEDVQFLHKGFLSLPADFWENHSEDMRVWQEAGKTYYQITGPLITDWYPNDCIYIDNDAEPFEAIVRKVENNHAIIEVALDYRQSKHAVWGITARNREQNFALNLLLDPNIDFVTLLGAAGSGKTLLALAAGLSQVMEQKQYHEIIMTRVTMPVGEDIGFLPGTEEEKMNPWMGALMDNLEVLLSNQEGSEWERSTTQDLIKQRIKIRSLNFMRGRTFLNRYVIIDEAQNLTSKQMKTLITRAGPGTKMICLGDIRQIDTPYLSETTSGLTYAVDRFKTCQFSGHIHLMRGERSRLADFAATHL